MGKHCLETKHQQYMLLFIKQIQPQFLHETSNLNSMNLANEQYLQMLSEYLKIVESTVQQTDPIADDCVRLNSEREILEHKFGEIRKQLKAINDASANNVKLIQTLNELVMDLKRLIDEIDSKPVGGPLLIDDNDIYTWKISSVFLFNDSTSTVQSGPFQTAQWGYKLGMSMTLQIDEQNLQRNVAASFVIFRGEYDAILQWPFPYPIALCLVDLAGTQNHIIHCIVPDTRSVTFGKPSNTANMPYHIAQFCPIERLVENGTNYVRDGNMYVKLHVDFTKKGVHPFSCNR